MQSIKRRSLPVWQQEKIKITGEAAGSDSKEEERMGAMGWVVYFVFLIGLMYFIAIRPQQKEKKKQQELLASVAVGDSVLTTSGFYGVIIDMTDDTVIVEFGSNKNCRIPMRKDAIVQVEKPEV